MKTLKAIYQKALMILEHGVKTLKACTERERQSQKRTRTL